MKKRCGSDIEPVYFSLSFLPILSVSLASHSERFSLIQDFESPVNEVRLTMGARVSVNGSDGTRIVRVLFEEL